MDAVNRCKEYPTLIKMIRNKIGAEKYLTLIKEVIKATSLRRLMEGGQPILAAINKNQGIANAGAIDRIPLVKNSLRVWVISYRVLAAANKPDDDRPWETIISKAPWNAQALVLIIPAAIRPIWATDL